MAFEGTDDFTNLVHYGDRLRSDARRYEVTTLAFQDHLGLTTSIGLLTELGVDAIAQYLRALAEPVLAWARRRGARIVSPTEEAHRSAIVCVAPGQAREAHRRLRHAGIVCAYREGAIRLSPHCYNTIEEMEKVVEVLEGAERGTGE
jgi:selenocysteine lyase/cysteine desulfurase